MLRRQALFFLVTAAPIAWFAFRSPLVLLALPLSGLAAWWAASPVSWPRWLGRGLVRSGPFAAFLGLALWYFTR